MSTIKHANLLSVITKITHTLATLSDMEESRDFNVSFAEQIGQLEDALGLLNEANTDTNERDEQTPAEQLERIKTDVALFVVNESEQISNLCNRLGYQDGSRLSHIIDRLELVESDLNGFEILGR